VFVCFRPTNFTTVPGIRCVKVGAYLTQELGFTNVSRLAGGIIAYDRTLSEQAQEEKPLFKGTNFVFDGRLGRPITEDAMGVCGTCGNETSAVSNCRNDYCHKRMIQCETCKTSYHGTCSTACRHRVVLGRGRMVPPPSSPSIPNGDSSSVVPPKRQTRKFDSIQDYCVGQSSSVPSFYQEIEFNTRAYLPSGAHMVSGAEQGRLLTQLASMTREGRILELGTFTGYATACFVEGAANAGRAIGGTAGNAQGGPYVMTLERDARALNLASAHLGILAQYGLEDDTEPQRTEAMRALRENDNDNNNKGLPVIDQDMFSLSLFNDTVGCDIVRVTDALATVEEIAMGSSSSTGGPQVQQPAPFDLVFVDADKTRLLEYVEVCLRNDNVLKPGGYIVVDNVLWKGLVVEASAGDFSSLSPASSSSDLENEDPNSSSSSSGSEEEWRKNRRARRLANQMHAFNSAIVLDKRVEVLLLPMRDGLSVIRKR
jgi:predicted O-methyltransferase YrrM